MSVTTEQSDATALRPFQAEFPDEALEDLRRRIAATLFHPGNWLAIALRASS